MKLPSLFRKRVETAAETITLADHAQVVLRLQNQLAETTAEAIDRHTWKERAEQAARDLQCERDTVARLAAQVRDLKPDAERYREKLRRDREYHANRRKPVQQEEVA